MLSLTLPTIALGPVTIQTWGLFVALGIVVGTWAAGRMARRRGLDAAVVWDAAAWMTVSALVGARVGHVAFYEPATYLADPWSAFAVWEGGMSMFGGMVGAVAAGWAYARWRGVDAFAYADAVAYGMPLGIGIGRIGCFLIHDHPGTLTSFVLGVRFPDGSVRHDLGLYESMFGFALATVFLLMARRGARPPAFLVVFLVAYGTFRMLADVLRVADTRYMGLTPAQYASFILIAIGLWIAWGIQMTNPPRMHE